LLCGFESSWLIFFRRSIYCALTAQEEGIKPVLSCAEGAENGLVRGPNYVTFTHNTNYTSKEAFCKGNFLHFLFTPLEIRPVRDIFSKKFLMGLIFAVFVVFFLAKERPHPCP